MFAILCRNGAWCEHGHLCTSQPKDALWDGWVDSGTQVGHGAEEVVPSTLPLFPWEMRRDREWTVWRLAADTDGRNVTINVNLTQIAHCYFNHGDVWMSFSVMKVNTELNAARPQPSCDMSNSRLVWGEEEEDHIHTHRFQTNGSHRLVGKKWFFDSSSPLTCWQPLWQNIKLKKTIKAANWKLNISFCLGPILIGGTFKRLSFLQCATHHCWAKH